MPTTIQTINVLRNYLSGVLERADHHADNVNEIALAIAGGIIWKTTEDIRVMSREGEMKNVLWMQKDKRRLCFVYNHSLETIEVREDSIQGTVIASFTNSSTVAEVKGFFEQL